MDEADVSKVINEVNAKASKLMGDDAFFAEAIADDLPEISKVLDHFHKIQVPIIESTVSPYAWLFGGGLLGRIFGTSGDAITAGAAAGGVVGFFPNVLATALSTPPGRRLIVRALRNNKGVYDRKVSALVSTFVVNLVGNAEFERMKSEGSALMRHVAPKLRQVPGSKVKRY